MIFICQYLELGNCFSYILQTYQCLLHIGDRYSLNGGANIINPRNTFIGKDVIIDSIYPEDIIIEEGVVITARCIVLSHFVGIENNKRVFYRGKVVIKNNTFIGCNTVICKPVTIGDHCVIGASSVVTHDIPSWEIWAGNPAKLIRKRTKD